MFTEKIKIFVSYMFQASGLVMLVIGVWMMSQLHKYVDTESPIATTLPIIFLGLSAAILLLAALACCCTAKGKRGVREDTFKPEVPGSKSSFKKSRRRRFSFENSRSQLARFGESYHLTGYFCIAFHWLALPRLAWLCNTLHRLALYRLAFLLRLRS